MHTRMLNKVVTEGNLQLSVGVGKEVLEPLSMRAIPRLTSMVCKKSASLLYSVQKYC